MFIFQIVRLAKTFFVLVITFSVFSCKGFHRQKVSGGEVTSPKVESQNEKKTYLDISEGVSCGFLDKKGMLWFGTNNNGVYSYDGKGFTNYTKKDGLGKGRVSCITEDRSGNLWFGTADGLYRYDRRAFKHIPIPKKDTSGVWLDKIYPVVNPNEVLSVLQDKNGLFWIGTNGTGAYSYDGETFTNYLSDVGRKQSDSLYHNIIQSITEDTKGNIWFTSMTHGGVSFYNGKTFTHFMPKDGLSDDMVRTCFMDRAGNIWFGFNGNRGSGITYYNGNSFTSLYKEDGLCNTNIRGIYEDKAGKLWLGSGRGRLCIYDGKTFSEFKSEEGKSFTGILFILEDANSNIWFGGKKGLWKYDGETVVSMTQHENEH